MDKKELKEIRSELINQFKSGITIDQLCNKYSARWCDMYDMISISLRHSIKEISEFEKYQIWMYNNAELYLERKYLKYQNRFAA